MYEWALFLHLAGAILFFAGLAVAAVAQRAARSRSRPGEVAALLGTARTGVLLVAVGILLAVGAGLWLLDLTAYGFDGWLVVSVGLLALALVAGGLGGRAPKRARRLAERLAESGIESSGELETLLRDRRADVLNWAAAALALAVLVLMVWKPGA